MKENKYTDLKLVIFDMDGLILDTEIMYFNTWLNNTKDFGLEYDIEKRYKYSGLNEDEVIKVLAKELGSENKARNLRKLIKKDRVNFFKNSKKSLKKEGIDELLDYLDEMNIKACVASSSVTYKILYLLERENILDKFDFIVSGEDIKNSKPAPDIFLEALNIGNVKREEALVLEDSKNGYLAAKNSGIEYMIVPDNSFNYHEKFSDKTYSSLKEVLSEIKKGRID